MYDPRFVGCNRRYFRTVEGLFRSRVCPTLARALGQGMHPGGDRLNVLLSEAIVRFRAGLESVMARPHFVISRWHHAQLIVLMAAPLERLGIVFYAFTGWRRTVMFGK